VPSQPRGTRWSTPRRAAGSITPRRRRRRSMAGPCAAAAATARAVLPAAPAKTATAAAAAPPTTRTTMTSITPCPTASRTTTTSTATTTTSPTTSPRAPASRRSLYGRACRAGRRHQGRATLRIPPRSATLRASFTRRPPRPSPLWATGPRSRSQKWLTSTALATGTMLMIPASPGPAARAPASTTATTTCSTRPCSVRTAARPLPCGSLRSTSGSAP
jgi:ribonuclease E